MLLLTAASDWLLLNAKMQLGLNAACDWLLVLLLTAKMRLLLLNAACSCLLLKAKMLLLTTSD